MDGMILALALVMAIVAAPIVLIALVIRVARRSPVARAALVAYSMAERDRQAREQAARRNPYAKSRR